MALRVNGAWMAGASVTKTAQSACVSEGTVSKVTVRGSGYDVEGNIHGLGPLVPLEQVCQTQFHLEPHWEMRITWRARHI